jgi:hypothetical protein
LSTPETTGDRIPNELWNDALGGSWRCTTAGTPGTWRQILPAAVTADPASGTIPTGYLILNVTQGPLKRHVGGVRVRDAWFGCKENIACCLKHQLTGIFQMKRGLLTYGYRRRRLVDAQFGNLVHTRTATSGRGGCRICRGTGPEAVTQARPAVLSMPLSTLGALRYSWAIS